MKRRHPEKSELPIAPIPPVSNGTESSAPMVVAVVVTVTDVADVDPGGDCYLGDSYTFFQAIFCTVLVMVLLCLVSFQCVHSERSACCMRVGWMNKPRKALAARRAVDPRLIFDRLPQRRFGLCQLALIHQFSFTTGMTSHVSREIILASEKVFAARERLKGC